VLIVQRYVSSEAYRVYPQSELLLSESWQTPKRQIEEADKNAALRDQMMKATLAIQEDLSQKIGEAVSM